MKAQASRRSAKRAKPAGARHLGAAADRGESQAGAPNPKFEILLHVPLKSAAASLLFTWFPETDIGPQVNVQFKKGRRLLGPLTAEGMLRTLAFQILAAKTIEVPERKWLAFKLWQLCECRDATEVFGWRRQRGRPDRTGRDVLAVMHFYAHARYLRRVKHVTPNQARREAAREVCETWILAPSHLVQIDKRWRREMCDALNKLIEIGKPRGRSPTALLTALKNGLLAERYSTGESLYSRLGLDADSDVLEIERALSRY